MKTRLLIVGDSFSSLQLSDKYGWPALLEKHFSITNLSSPGIGEYKIMRKLLGQDLKKYDGVIISHTSPNRIHCEINPLYPARHLYRNSDIIFADAESKQPNSESIIFIEHFKKIFDFEYYKFIHTNCCREIDLYTKNIPVIHMTNFDWSGLYRFDRMINFYKYWLNNRGNYVHYTTEANQFIAELLQMEVSQWNFH